jgi:Histidine kinase-, DNA gyrase B-, and HSP90-like ATPase
MTMPNHILKKPDAELPSPTPDQVLKTERADWASFRTPDGLQQKAGVSLDGMIRLVLKELTDNGLDAGASVNVGHLPDGGYFIEDDGSGIDGTPEDVARLYSIARPMVSTKLLRLPTRGALGNGLRVVAGSVLASDGSLTVTTRGKRITLRPERDGSTSVAGVKTVNSQAGTRIEISFGPAIPRDANALH